MKSYYRLMLGRKSLFARQCFEEGFIGVDFEIAEDLTGKLPEDWREFNKEYIPLFLQRHPSKTKIGAGLGCAVIWTVAKGMLAGDRVLCPDGNGMYHVGEVTGDYYYAPDKNLIHCRPVTWLTTTIARAEMSDALRSSVNSIGTVRNLTPYRDEIEHLLKGSDKEIEKPVLVEDPVAFALEKHLEDFLVVNWSKTKFGKEYDIAKEDGEIVGQQYPTDTGPIDILAIRKDKKEILIIELKRGRASDVVMGQILRYMGYVMEELAENGQTVKGVVIALEDDKKLRRALIASPNIAFYRYQIDFKLLEA
jgi:restriction system protein